MIQPPPLPPLPPLLGLPHAPTLADHAEAWARENGLGVPARRAGRAWAALYRTWVDYAFAGLAEHEPEVIELPTTLRPPEFRLVPDFDPWDEDDIRHYGPGKPAPDSSGYWAVDGPYFSARVDVHVTPAGSWTTFPEIRGSLHHALWWKLRDAPMHQTTT